MPDVVAEGQDPGGNPDWVAEESRDARRADALVALGSQRLASDADPDRTTVVIQAELSALVGGPGGVALEDGPAIHPETARRLSCDGRLQTVVSDGGQDDRDRQHLPYRFDRDPAPVAVAGPGLCLSRL